MNNYPLIILQLLFKLLSTIRLQQGISLALACIFTFSSLPSLAQTSAETNDLNAVKDQIKQQKNSIKLTSTQQKQIEKKLKEDDLAIAKTAKKMNELKQKKQITTDKITALNSQQQELLTKKKQQEDVLAEQIRSAYSAGHHDYLKLLLNQQGPNNVDRTLTYYQYLNDARIRSIDNFKEIITELKAVEEQQLQQAEKLQALVDKQLAEKQALESQRTSRKQTLKTLNSQILSSKQRLNKLEGEEKSLIQALARIQAQLQKERELKGLSKLKNKLRWPVKGTLTHRFGTKKQGYLRWKGVHLSSRLGRDVTSIHNGTVLFADWLKGYGLVIVLDHGEGYMSLYGHNQALLKDVGDRVEIGEPIALVGQSGGQSQTGLYFEIRHKGKPVNPKLWCK